MKNLKKFASLFLALAMCLSLLPATALAADGSGLQDLIDQASVGSTVTLTQNYTLTAPVTVNKAVTIDGGMHTVTAASNQNALNVTAEGVTVKNLAITTGYAYAIDSTGHTLTVEDCTINTTGRGVNFYPTVGAGAVLKVTGTTIKNTNVSNYNITADYGRDNRGINAGGVTKGQVTIDSCQIYGFKYSINALILAPNSNGTGLRNGEGTVYDITNSTVKGWTALSIWSANSTFNLTDCNFVGINTLSGTTNNYATIEANSGMYGGRTDMSSTVTVYGGTLTAVHYGAAGEAVISVDHELQTKFVFDYSPITFMPVSFEYYGADVTSGRVGVWNFDYLDEDCDDPDTLAGQYMKSHVEGYPDNTTLTLGTTAQYEAGLATYRAVEVAMEEYEIEPMFMETVVGGDIA